MLLYVTGLGIQKVFICNSIVSCAISQEGLRLQSCDLAQIGRYSRSIASYKIFTCLHNALITEFPIILDVGTMGQGVVGYSGTQHFLR